MGAILQYCLSWHNVTGRGKTGIQAGRQAGEKLEYVNEHIAIVRSLDVKNLPTISAEEDSLCFKL